MKTKQQIEQEFLREKWEDISGKKFPVQRKIIPYPELYQKYWDKWIEILPLMVNRMVLGDMRYDDIDNGMPGDYPYIDASKKRLDFFEDDGNLEHLLDSANIILKRFYLGKKFGEKFIALDESKHNTYRRK